jgi:hypothetical protein
LKGGCSRLSTDTGKLICDLSEDLTCEFEVKTFDIYAALLPQQFACRKIEKIVGDRSDGTTNLITLIYKAAATKS